MTISSNGINAICKHNTNPQNCGSSGHFQVPGRELKSRGSLRASLEELTLRLSAINSDSLIRTARAAN
jgi:hypothetical protein